MKEKQRTRAGALLVRARQERHLSQRELADLAGVAQSEIAKIESGKREPSMPTLQRILAGAGLELRVRLTPLDDHDAILAGRHDRRSPEGRAALDARHDDDVDDSPEAVMAGSGPSSELARCSFCGKSHKEVEKLIAGPGAFICNRCIELCNDIIDEEQAIAVGRQDVVPPKRETSAPDDVAGLLGVRQRLVGRLGRRPTVAELAGETGLSQEQVTESLRRAASTGIGGAGRTGWERPVDAQPLAAALRAVQQQLSELGECLAGLVDQAEHQDDPNG